MIELRAGWFTAEIAEAVDLDKAGVYEWRIEGVGVYVGKAKVLRNRIGAYPRNVCKLLNGLPWHGNPNREYRRVHHELRKAHDAGVPVTVTILENCEPERRLERERHWIELRRREAKAGGASLLNATAMYQD